LGELPHERPLLQKVLRSRNAIGWLSGGSTAKIFLKSAMVSFTPSSNTAMVVWSGMSGI